MCAWLCVFFLNSFFLCEDSRNVRTLLPDAIYPTPQLLRKYIVQLLQCTASALYPCFYSLRCSIFRARYLIHSGALTYEILSRNLGRQWAGVQVVPRTLQGPLSFSLGSCTCEYWERHWYYISERRFYPNSTFIHAGQWPRTSRLVSEFFTDNGAIVLNGGKHHQNHLILIPLRIFGMNLMIGKWSQKPRKTFWKA
jgi:hypothetical protein